MKVVPTWFEEFQIRRIYDEKTETWYFSVVDIIQVLTQQPDFQAARNYWKVLKNRLGKEGSQSVTKCNRLKLPAEDGKMRETDVASPEILLRLVQSVPSPKAEPITLGFHMAFLQNAFGYGQIPDRSRFNCLSTTPIFPPHKHFLIRCLNSSPLQFRTSTRGN